MPPRSGAEAGGAPARLRVGPQQVDDRGGGRRQPAAAPKQAGQQSTRGPENREKRPPEKPPDAPPAYSTAGGHQRQSEDNVRVSRCANSDHLPAVQDYHAGAEP